MRATAFPFPVPNGWFAIAEAGEIEPGTTRALHYFERDLVAWRDHQGAVHLTDAYCAHQGAHLAVGGKIEEVDGEQCLRCPFHGWAFDGDGQCREIPYGESERIPAKANMRTYPVVERGPYIWAWYHAEGADPFYDLPDIPDSHSARSDSFRQHFFGLQQFLACQLGRVVHSFNRSRTQRDQSNDLALRSLSLLCVRRPGNGSSPRHRSDLSLLQRDDDRSGRGSGRGSRT